MSDKNQDKTLTIRRASDADEVAFETFVASVDGVTRVTRIFPKNIGKFARWYFAYAASEKASAVRAALQASPLVAAAYA